MDLDRWSKRTQYLTVDSDFVDVDNGSFTLEFGFSSNVFLQEMRDVVHVRLVDFYASGINGDTVKYVDILAPDIPLSAQTLDERNGQIFARIMNERGFDGDMDKQAKLFSRTVSFFNPISFKNLRFSLFESHNDGVYLPLSSGTQFHMVLEIVTLDHLNPPVDNNFKLINAIDHLVQKIDELIAAFPKEDPTKKKKIPLVYLAGALIAVFGLWYYFSRPSSPIGSSVPLAPPPVPVQSLGAQGLLRPGVLPRGF